MPSPPDLPSPASFSTLKTGDNAYVVSVEGELDLYSAPELAAELDALVADAPDVVLDLSGVGFVDSTALGAIVGASRSLRAGGGRLLLVASRDVRMVLELVGLDRILPVYESTERALEHLVGSVVLRKLEER